jgi:hypothetical protein
MKPLSRKAIVMIEVEFQAKVENGVIVVPEEYQGELAEVEQVKVTLRKLPKPPFFEDKFVAQLLQNPVPVAGVRYITREKMHEQ